MNIRQTLRIKRRNAVRLLQLLYCRMAVGVTDNYPDFMCIGAPRAATTWLHQKLAADLRIFLPKIKELHFFDEPDLAADDFDGELRWHRHFYFDVYRPAHLRWYHYQFRNSDRRLKGEITPAYSTLSCERIAYISDLMPALRVIYIIRNPVERAWSGVRKSVWYQEGRDFDFSAKNQIIRNAVLHPETLNRGNYPQILKNWKAVIPDDRFLCLFYDDIDKDATGELNKIYEFLQMPPPDSLPVENSGSRVNAAPSNTMPDEIRRALVEHYRDQVAQLEITFDRDLSHWFEPGERLAMDDVN